MDNNSIYNENSNTNEVIYERVEEQNEKRNVPALLSFIFGCVNVALFLLAAFGKVFAFIPFIGGLVSAALAIPRMLSVPLDIAGIILGIIARKKTDKGKWMSVVGMILCVMDILVIIAMAILSILLATLGIGLGIFSIFLEG